MTEVEFRAEVVSLLEGITRQLGDLISIVTAARRTTKGKALSRKDRDALAELLPLVWKFCGGSDFLAGELCQHSTGNAKQDADLQSAIEAVIGTDVGGMSHTRGLGRLFARAEGVAVQGLVIERLGPTRAGALWRVSHAGSGESP